MFESQRRAVSLISGVCMLAWRECMISGTRAVYLHLSSTLSDHTIGLSGANLFDTDLSKADLTDPGLMGPHCWTEHSMNNPRATRPRLT